MYVCVWDKWDTSEYLKVNNLNISNQMSARKESGFEFDTNRMKYRFGNSCWLAQSLNRSQKHGKQ